MIGIAAGMLDGLQKSSLKGALMSRGTREIARLIEAMGGNGMTAYGLSHLGDYEATVFSQHSHNRMYGETFVKQGHYGELAEGVATAEAMVLLADRYGVELPICRTVHEVLTGRVGPAEGLAGLFLRSPSTQEYNQYINGGNEEYYANLIADAMEPYLFENGVSVTRNDPEGTVGTSVRMSNAGDYDLHLAIHSNAAPESLAGQIQGPDVYYYRGSAAGRRAAGIYAENLARIYPDPSKINIIPTTSLYESLHTTTIRRTRTGSRTISRLLRRTLRSRRLSISDKCARAVVSSGARPGAEGKVPGRPVRAVAGFSRSRRGL